MSVSIRNLNIVINGMPIVHDVDMDIADGERVGLIGSSGSGKSMIAKSIMGLLPLSAQVSGSIDMGGTEIVGASDQAIADLRGRYVGMVFQNPSAALNPVMTVAQQVALPLRLHYDLTRDERLDRVKAMFAKVRLPEDVLNKYPHELSGGRRHRGRIGHVAAPDYRRRANHRAGFDHATADRRSAGIVGGRFRRIHALHHPRFRGTQSCNHTLLCTC